MDSTPALSAIARVPVTVSVVLAETEIPVDAILEWKPGATIAFPQRVDEPLTIEVDGRPVGGGSALLRDRQLGVRVDTLRRREESKRRRRAREGER